MPPDSGTPEGLKRRKTLQRWIYAIIVAWGVSFIIMAVFGTYSIIQGQRVNRALCRVSDDNRTVLLNLLRVQEQQALEDADDILERNLVRIRFGQLRAIVPNVRCVIGGPSTLEP